MLHERPKVIIMGGSLGGLTAALYLHAIGCEVTVYERSKTALTGLGAGIVLNPATVRYFVENEVLDLSTISTATRWLRYVDQTGNVAAEQASPYRMSSYNALYHGLLTNLPAQHYHLGEAVTSFAQDEQSVSVQLASGRQQRCDLLVCADGIRSTARRFLLPEVTLQYAGYSAWRGTIGMGKLTTATINTLSDAITYYVLPNSHLLTYPIQMIDPASGTMQPYLNWLWYRNIPAGTALDRLLTDRTGQLREVSVPAGSVQERHIAQLQEEARSLLPPPLIEVVLRSEQPFLQAIVDAAVPRMAFGRLCLIGDAAFVARPHAAAGTAKAAEDGYQLSQALLATGGDVVAALQQWETGQLRLGNIVLERTRNAGQRVQFDNTWRIGAPLPFGLYEVGDSMMT